MPKKYGDKGAPKLPIIASDITTVARKYLTNVTNRGAKTLLKDLKLIVKDLEATFSSEEKNATDSKTTSDKKASPRRQSKK